MEELALVADDDPQVLAITARWLMTAGYNVVTASDFADARAQIRLREPGIVIADVRLGEFNGIQLGLLAREIRPDVRVVIISGFDDTVLRRDARDIGAAFLQKPLRAAALLVAVEEESAPLPS